MLRQGDIIRIDFNPSLGHEPKKVRPAIVVSSDRFNRRSSTTVLVPVTSNDNGHPFHVEIDAGSGTYGFACVEQMKALDVEARRFELIGEVPSGAMNEILNLIGAVFEI